MSDNPYLFKQVSLLSTSDVRYDGRLYIIDLEAKTLALQHVRCLGTEGRRQGEEAIAPSDCTYEFIIFRAENIQRLTLAGDNEPYRDLTKEILEPLRGSKSNRDRSSHSPTKGGSRDYGSDNRGYGREARKRKVGNVRDNYYSNRYERNRYPSYSQARPYPEERYQYDSYRGYYGGRYQAPQQYRQYPPYQQYRGNYDRYQYRQDGRYSTRRNRSNRYSNKPNRRNNRRDGARAGTGAFLGDLNVTGEEIDTPKEAFDFTTANEQMQDSKEDSPVENTETTETKAAEPVQQSHTSAYDKKVSFFDNLTLDTNSRAKRLNTDEVDIQKSLDAETFGTVAEKYKSRHFSRRRGNYARTQSKQKESRPRQTQQQWRPRQ